MALVFVPLVDTICQGIATKADEQTENDLRIAMSAFFRETRFAEIVFVVRLKVKRGDIIEKHPDVAAEQFGRVMNADVLHQLMLVVAQPVEIAVYFRQVNVIVKVILQILHSGRFARGICQACLHELAEHLVLYAAEAYAVESAVQNQVATVEKNVLDP